MQTQPSCSWRLRLIAGLAVPLALAVTSGAPTIGAVSATQPGALVPRVISVNAASPQQTMRGWEVLGEAHQERPDYANFQAAALDKVAQAGINRIRLEVRSGAENPVDAFAAWQAAGYPQGPDPRYATWRAKRYETINDNSDPNSLNPAGYHFTELDWAVDNIVNPLRARLAAKGESLYVTLNYVAFLSQVTSGVPYVHEQPAEYAEFALAAFEHLQQRYGWVPNGLEIMLEPDNVLPTWNPNLVGRVIAATGPKLAAAGYHPDLIAASTVCMSAAVDYFDGIMAVGGVLPYLKELSYHRYCGVSLSTLQTIAARAASVGIGTAMLEWWDPNNSFLTLHEDLKTGRNGAWQQGAIVDLDSNLAAGTISTLDPEAPANVRFTNPTQFFRRYFEFVRMGAVRLDTTSSSGETDALAFRNPNGAFTVVVKADAAGAIDINGLPAGTYGIDYTASSVASADSPDRIGSLPDQTIGTGQTLSTSIPAWGVITIHGKADNQICADLFDNSGNAIDAGCPPVPGAPVGLTADVAGSIVTLHWAAPVTGGPVESYVLDAGLTPGATAVSVPLGASTDTQLPGVPQGTYRLRVRAVGAKAVSSAPSNEVAVTVGGCAAAPPAPRGLTAHTNGPMVTLTWLDDQGCEGRRYHVVAGSRSGTADLGAVGVAATTVNAPVPPGRYYVRVVTENARGVSAPSNEVMVVSAGACQAPALDLTLTGTVQQGVLSLQWGPVSASAADALDAATPLAYVLEAGTTPGSSNLGTFPIGRRTALTAPVPAGRYSLRVRASSACGSGPASKELTLTVP